MTNGTRLGEVMHSRDLECLPSRGIDPDEASAIRVAEAPRVDARQEPASVR